MRTVFPSCEVPHKWAYQTQSHARNAGNTLYFRDSTIYSYGEHFPIARIVERPNGGRVVLFTTEVYSVTTSRHIGMTRRAIPDYMPVINVPNVGQGAYSRIEDEQDAQQQNVLVITREVQDLLAKAGRARIANRPWYLKKAQERAEDAKRLAEFFRLPVPTFPEFTGESAKEIAALVKQAEEEAKRQAEERNRLRRAELERAAQDWIRGDVLVRTGLYNIPPRLRVASDGETVETSHGASFPLSHAVRLWPVLCGLRERGATYQRNGHTIHLGDFAVDSFDGVTGELCAGCHRLEWSEIERFARSIGLAAPVQRSA